MDVGLLFDSQYTENLEHGSPAWHYTRSPHFQLGYHGVSIPSSTSYSPPPDCHHLPIRLDAEEFLRQKLNIARHVEVNLDSIPNPPEGQRPSLSLPYLMMLAIYGSPQKMLTLQGIYAAVENRFEWYRDTRDDERAWKGSIRHSLSLWKVFRHKPRPATEPGRGKYWYLDFSDGEGYKRERKRKSRRVYSTGEHEYRSNTPLRLVADDYLQFI